MTLTVTSKRLPSAEPGSSNQHQQRSYTVSYQVQQTDTGARGSAEALITAAQSGSPNAIPVYGDTHSYDGTTDADSYAQQFDWQWGYGADQQKILHVDVKFMPADGVHPDKFSEPDPILWPTEYWVEWTEEQVVLERATNVEELPDLGRAALTQGKVVNACGVEFTEPLMKTVLYPVLHCQKAYATLAEIVALNTTYQDTTNNGSFFGSATRTAKYLGTESGRIQKAGGVSFYMGITRIWFKKETWDRRVLNNGWSHFDTNAGGLITDSSSNPKLFKNMVYDSSSADSDDPDVPCSEPLNLSLNGMLLGATSEPVYITYRYLEEVDYAGIGIGS